MESIPHAGLRTVSAMQIVDLSLKNEQLYKGCSIEEVAGRLNLTTPIAEAISIVGKNANEMGFDSEEVVLTGPMAVWSYLIVFHACVHKTRVVKYDDGRSGAVVVAKHG
jgi:hypothetical protein